MYLASMDIGALRFGKGKPEANQEMWQYTDSCGRDTFAWAIQMAQKYNTCIGVGYLNKNNGTMRVKTSDNLTNPK
ncbi:hypothetical protein [Ruminiclostridium papyrosolvens]|uniref:Uncharacterized protein n=1 Tax=Ruminiclostridium papyrosolvens C7 TaxID=1330534 RepID=U4R3J6_9FIRM|nr:hypothetical protein [Ruminiclostridium papyrosolvens]EPR12331.1 hypothetical protein L323_08390 [Ruminiclostridium papyrosolvens C7]